jgi:hypothetical protein
MEAKYVGPTFGFLSVMLSSQYCLHYDGRGPQGLVYSSSALQLGVKPRSKTLGRQQLKISATPSLLSSFQDSTD